MHSLAKLIRLSVKCAVATTFAYKSPKAKEFQLKFLD